MSNKTKAEDNNTKTYSIKQKNTIKEEELRERERERNKQLNR